MMLFKDPELFNLVSTLDNGVLASLENCDHIVVDAGNDYNKVSLESEEAGSGLPEGRPLAGSARSTQPPTAGLEDPLLTPWAP